MKMRIREILAQNCQELIKKPEKMVCVIGGSDQSRMIQKNKNRQRLLNKIEIGYFLLQDNFREKLSCVIDLPLPQSISSTDFTKKIDLFTGNWNRKLNICKQYNINLPKHELLEWNYMNIDSFNSTVNLFLASNLPAIPIPELFEHIIGFFQHSIPLQPFDFHTWKSTEKQRRNPPKCISIAKSNSKSFSIGEVKNFENEVEIEKIAKEMDEKEPSVTMKNVQLHNSQLHQNAAYVLLNNKNTEVRNETGDKNLLNFHKSYFGSKRKRIDLGFSELAVVKKQMTERNILLFNCKNLNWHQEFVNSPVRIESQFIINKSNENMKCVPYDNNRPTSDESQSQNAKDNITMDMFSELTEKEDIMDRCNVMPFSNNKKHYQNNDSNFPTNCLLNIEVTNRSICSAKDSKRGLNSFNINIKTFGLSNIRNENKLCKKSWATLLMDFNIQTIATHIQKLLPIFLYNSESISYHLPTIYNKHIISCSPHQHGFSSEYETKKSIALGNNALLSDKSLICVPYTDACSNFQAMTNTRELDENSRMAIYKSTTQLNEESLHVSTLPNENVYIARELDENSRMAIYKSTTQLNEESLHVSTLPNENVYIARELDENSRMAIYKSTTQLNEESLHVSTLPNENVYIANIPDPSKSDSLKDNLITVGSNNLIEEGHFRNDFESKSQSFVLNDNNLSASSCTEIASNQNENSAHFSAQIKVSASTEGSINCPEYRDFDYNCWTNTVQDYHSVPPTREQSSLCRDNMITADSESKSGRDSVPTKTRTEEDGDKAQRIDKLIVDEDEHYNEYRVIKKPRLQLIEDRCFHEDTQCRIYPDENKKDSHDQMVPANDDRLSFHEESTSLYNNCSIGNGAFCWNSSLLPSYSDMKDSSKEYSVVLPLATCNKPLRVGLSKRQKLPPLHPQAKKRRCMQITYN